MAIYHCSIKNINRSNGRSAVAAASYRAGDKLKDDRTGLTHDFQNKPEIVYSEIFLCDNAPQSYSDRQTLWNSVESAEKASNSRTAREFEVAIPNELTLEQAKDLIQKFSKSLANEGMCVDANIHWKENNHHAHILTTTRAIDERGEWCAKSRKVYEKDENGDKIPLIDKKTGLQKLDSRNRKQWKSHKEDTVDWNKKEKVVEWRERWAKECNLALEKAHSLERIDSRSYEEQGIERIPTIHEGYAARQIESRGEIAERCEINREIAADNAEIERINLEFLEKEQERIKLLELLKVLKQKVSEIYERFTRERDGAVRENDGRDRSSQRGQFEAEKGIGELLQTARERTKAFENDSRSQFLESKDEISKSRTIDGTARKELNNSRIDIDNSRTAEQDRAAREQLAEQERRNREFAAERRVLLEKSRTREKEQRSRRDERER